MTRYDSFSSLKVRGPFRYEEMISARVTKRQPRGSTCLLSDPTTCAPPRLEGDQLLRSRVQSLCAGGGRARPVRAIVFWSARRIWIPSSQPVDEPERDIFVVDEFNSGAQQRMCVEDSRPRLQYAVASKEGRSGSDTDVKVPGKILVSLLSAYRQSRRRCSSSDGLLTYR